MSRRGRQQAGPFEPARWRSASDSRGNSAQCNAARLFPRSLPIFVSGTCGKTPCPPGLDAASSRNAARASRASSVRAASTPALPRTWYVSPPYSRRSPASISMMLRFTVGHDACHCGETAKNQDPIVFGRSPQCVLKRFGRRCESSDTALGAIVNAGRAQR